MMLLKTGTTTNRRVARAAVLAFAGLALAACAPTEPLTDAEVDRGHQLRPPYQVEYTVHRHLLPVSVTDTTVTEQQFRDLFDFLIGVGVKTGDRVVLASRRSRLEQRDQVHQFLRRAGVHINLQLIKDSAPGSDDDGYDNVIMVRFDRYTQRQHECGQWGEKVRSNFYGTSHKNFGCATTANLQQQVAYPSSLIEGEPLAFPEGDVAAEAITRYRARETEEIEEESAADTGG